MQREILWFAVKGINSFWNVARGKKNLKVVAAANQAIQFDFFSRTSLIADIFFETTCLRALSSFYYVLVSKDFHHNSIKSYSPMHSPYQRPRIFRTFSSNSVTTKFCRFFSLIRHFRLWFIDSTVLIVYVSVTLVIPCLCVWVQQQAAWARIRMNQNLPERF